MSKYYIYKMTALTEDGSKGSYIGQHKIGRKSPLNDGYRGSGSDWKKYILQRNVPVEKVILRMCDNIKEANQWERFYIKQAKEDGIYLWNRCRGGSYERDKKYTDEEIAEHRRQYNKQYRDANREKIAKQKKQYYEANKEHKKQYDKQYYEENKEHIAEHIKQYYEANKEHKKQYNQKYYEANKEQIAEHIKQYRETNKEQQRQYNKQWYETNKESYKKYKKEYNNQLCKYNGETLTLAALGMRFRKAGLEHSVIEAKKYLIV